MNLHTMKELGFIHRKIKGWIQVVLRGRMFRIGMKVLHNEPLHDKDVCLYYEGLYGFFQSYLKLRFLRNVSGVMFLILWE